jgi:hypothetical protein
MSTNFFIGKVEETSESEMLRIPENPYKEDDSLLASLTSTL